jgi:GTPase SAR1 family protein
LIIGQKGVGKRLLQKRLFGVFSSIDLRKNRSSSQNIDKAVCDFIPIQTAIDHDATINIWLSPMGSSQCGNIFLENMDFIILVYDVTNRKSFEFIIHEMDELINRRLNSKVNFIILANKVDDEKDIVIDRQVKNLRGRKWAEEEHGALYIEGSNYADTFLFKYLIDYMMKIINQRNENYIDEELFCGELTINETNITNTTGDVNNQAIKIPPEWKDSNCCQSCVKKFTLLRRKHHCRACGGCFCNSCSHNRVPLAFGTNNDDNITRVRVCHHCFLTTT